MNFIILEAAQTQAQQGGTMQFMFTMGLMFLIIYFLIFRPQRKRQKEIQNMLENLKINDNVVTNGGILGKVVNIKKEKNIVVIRVDDTTKTKIEVQKSAIAGVINEKDQG